MGSPGGRTFVWRGAGRPVVDVAFCVFPGNYKNDIGLLVKCKASVCHLKNVKLKIQMNLLVVCQGPLFFLIFITKFDLLKKISLEFLYLIFFKSNIY